MNSLLYDGGNYELSDTAVVSLRNRSMITPDAREANSWRFTGPLEEVAQILLSYNEEMYDDKPHYSCCLFWHDGVLPLIRKSHPDWQKGRLNGIGGRAEDGEAPEQCARREWSEETETAAPDEIREFVTLEDDEVIVHFFTGEFRQDPELSRTHNDIGEEFDVYLEGDRVPFDCIDNLQWLIPMSREKYHAGGYVRGLRRTLVNGQWV